MSTTLPTSTRTAAVAIGAVVAIFVATIAGVVTIAIAVKDGALATALIGLLFTGLGSTVGTVVTLLKVTGIAGKVDRVAADTHDLTNGLLDAKIRSGVADVVHDDYLDPDTAPLVASDRRRRQAATGE